MESVTQLSPSPVNHLVTESLNGRLILDAARELDRQYIADAPVAFDLAEIAAKHEQDQIQDIRPKAFDQLSGPARAELIANAKAGLRMNRPAWRALQFARMQQAATEAIRDLAGRWIPADQIEPLALFIAERVGTAGRFALDELVSPPMPREFATALQIVQRRGER